MKIIILGDDLYCKQPLCELLLSHGFNFILVCTLESHPTQYAWIDTLAAAGDLNLLKMLVVRAHEGG